MDLRTLLAWTVYATIGMALGSAPPPEADSDLAILGIGPPINLNPHFALLGAASAAMAVGLVQQARSIRRQTADWPDEFAPFHTGARWEAGLRWGLAAMLVGCMTIQLLNMQGFVTFPEDDLFLYDDVVTQYLWWLAVLIVLGDAVRRVDGGRPHRSHWLINGVIGLGLLGLATYMVTDLALVNYLVHVACRGVDAAQPLRYQRYPVTTLGSEWSLILTNAGGAAVIVIAAALMLRQIANHGLNSLRRPKMLAALALLLGVSGGISYYHYAIERYWLAPDLEGIGFTSSWWQRAGGVAVAAVLVTYAIYRCWHASAALATTTASSHASLALPLAGEQFFVLFVLAAPAVLYMGQSIWAAFNAGYLTTPLEGLLYLTLTPSTYFIMAMLALGLRLIRLRWQGRVPAPLVVIPLRSSDFILAWLLLAAIVAVAIPTFAAFGFAYWLGPWYRW